jgi:hypothetical protein
MDAFKNFVARVAEGREKLARSTPVDDDRGFFRQVGATLHLPRR